MSLHLTPALAPSPFHASLARPTRAAAAAAYAAAVPAPTPTAAASGAAHSRGSTQATSNGRVCHPLLPLLLVTLQPIWAGHTSLLTPHLSLSHSTSHSGLQSELITGSGQVPLNSQDGSCTCAVAGSVL